jgi:hypothetical protein
VWQIGNEGGFLAAPVSITSDNGNRLLIRIGPPQANPIERRARAILGKHG